MGDDGCRDNRAMMSTWRAEFIRPGIITPLIMAGSALNALIYGKTGVVPRNHGERRMMLREIGRKDLRTLHDEVFYKGVYEPDEVSYAINRIEGLIRELMSG